MTPEAETMRRYFRKQTGPMTLGIGTAWFEFDGENALRQIERYGDQWFTSRKDYHPQLGPGLVDLPLSELDLGAEDEITAEEFERVWADACANEG